jgi:hypothetical protein
VGGATGREEDSSMKHIRPVSAARAQFFQIFLEDVRQSLNAFVIAKKNLRQSGGTGL